jgi:hypothetical protein
MEEKFVGENLTFEKEKYKTISFFICAQNSQIKPSNFGKP